MVMQLVTLSTYSDKTRLKIVQSIAYGVTMLKLHQSESRISLFHLPLAHTGTP